MAKSNIEVLNQVMGAGSAAPVTRPFAPAPVAAPNKIKTPATIYQSNSTSFNTRWQGRIKTFGSAGLNLDQHVKPVYDWDKERVEQGDRPFTDAQALDFVTSLKQGKPVVGLPKQHHGGLDLNPFDFIGNAVEDVGDIAQGLNPIKLIPALVNQVTTAVTHPDQLVKFLNAPDFDTAMTELGETPILAMVPGVYTATHVLKGDFQTLVEHPVSTFLDVSMVANGLGRLGAAAKIAKVIGESEKLSVAERAIETAKQYGKGRVTEARKAVETAKGLVSYAKGHEPVELVEGASRGVEQASRRRLVNPDQRTYAPRHIYGEGVEFQAHPHVQPVIDNPDATWAHADSAHVHFWGVDEEFRGQGGLRAGKAILNDADTAGITLTMFASKLDKQLQRLYTKFGFEKVDYANASDAERAAIDQMGVANGASPAAYDFYVREPNVGTAARRGIAPTPLTSLDRVFPADDDYHIIRDPNSVSVWHTLGEGTKIAHLDTMVDDAGVTHIVDSAHQPRRLYGNRTTVAKVLLEDLLRENQGTVSIDTVAHPEFEQPIRQIVNEHPDLADRTLINGKRPEVRAARVKSVPWATPQKIGRLEAAAEAAKEAILTANEESAKVVQAAINDYNRVYAELIPVGSPLEALATGKKAVAPATGATLEQLRPGVGHTNVWKAAARLPIMPVAGAKGILEGAGAAVEAARADQARQVAEASGGLNEINAAMQTAAKTPGSEVTGWQRWKQGQEQAKVQGVREATQPTIESALAREKGAIAENPTRVGITGPGSITEQLAQKYNIDKASREVLRTQAFSYRQGAYHPEYTILNDTYKKEQELALAHKQTEEAQLRAWQNEPVSHPSRTNMVNKYTRSVADADKRLREATDTLNRVGMADTVHTTWNLVGRNGQSLIRGYMNQGKTLEEAKSLLRSNYHTLDEYASRVGVNEPFKRYIVGRKMFGDEASLRMMARAEPAVMKDVWVPNHVYQSMMSLQKNYTSSLAKLYGDTTNVFKYAVLTGPRHVAHVLFSNAMFLGLDSMKNFSPAVIMQAFRKYREGVENWPSMLPTGAGAFDREIRAGGVFDEAGKLRPPKLKEDIARYTAQDHFAFAAGKTLGRIMRTIPDGFRHIEETITDMSRLMAYYAEGGGEAGIMHAVKVLMDVDGMTAFERQVLRQIVPFYPFTRQLFQYMTRYPIAHPVKAGILGAIGRIEMEDWGTGLPDQMMALFPIGGMDEDGNTLIMDTKSMNPFRGMNGLNPFTLAGFLSQLNPIITIPAKMAGLNTLTATPELYPTLTVDSHTGDIVATHPGAGWMALEAIIPEATILEQLIGHSNDLTQLAHTDPERFARVIASSFNMPFIPTHINYNRERVRYAKNLYSTAQEKTSLAAKKGNIDTLPYDYVPYQGRIYRPGDLQKMIGRTDQTNLRSGQLQPQFAKVPGGY